MANYTDLRTGHDSALQYLVTKNGLTLLSCAILPLFAILIRQANKDNEDSRSDSSNEPPQLRGSVPILSNTIQYLTDMEGFLARAKTVLQHSGLLRFTIGNSQIYMTSSPRDVQQMMRSQHGMTSDAFMLQVMEGVYGWSREDVEKWRADKTGRLPQPIPGTVAEQDGGLTAEVGKGQRPQRLWASVHHIHSEFLARAGPVSYLSDMYYSRLDEKLTATNPLGHWRTVTIRDFTMRDMSEAALTTILGTRILETNPDLIEATHDFEDNVVGMAWGLPRWMNPGPFRVRERLRGMTAKHLETALREFDWEGPDAEADWEPIFGARVTRELAKWMTTAVEPNSAAGLLAGLTIGVTINSVPMTMWSFMEVMQQPELMAELKEEIETAVIFDVATGAKRALDLKKLFSLPLLQSVYMETLRMHVSINMTRGVTQDTTMSGFPIRAGSVVQAPSAIVHYDEDVWGHEEHPASEFWGHRHLTQVESVDESGNKIVKKMVTTAGRASSFFPYGTGVSICPGRHLARNIVTTTLAMLLTRFETESVEWTNIDGSRSERAAKNDGTHHGTGSTPPDRDMKLRWKRLW